MSNNRIRDRERFEANSERMREKLKADRGSPANCTRDKPRSIVDVPEAERDQFVQDNALRLLKESGYDVDIS